jgi:hypothetical protein
MIFWWLLYENVAARSFQIWKSEQHHLSFSTIRLFQAQVHDSTSIKPSLKRFHLHPSS